MLLPEEDFRLFIQRVACLAGEPVIQLQRHEGHASLYRCVGDYSSLSFSELLPHILKRAFDDASSATCTLNNVSKVAGMQSKSTGIIVGILTCE